MVYVRVIIFHCEVRSHSLETIMKTALSIIGLALTCLIGLYFFLQDPEPDAETIEDTDTGFTRHETEERLRSIGYVQ